MITAPPTILATPASPLTSPPAVLHDPSPTSSSDGATTINPIYALSQQISSGELLEEVHIVRAKEGEMVLRHGAGASLLHPSTWVEHDDAPRVMRVGGGGSEGGQELVCVTEGRGKGKGTSEGKGRDESRERERSARRSMERARQSSPSIHSALERAASRDSVLTNGGDEGRAQSHAGASSDAGTSDGGHSRRGREQGSVSGSSKSLPPVNGSSYPPLSSSAPQSNGMGSFKRNSIVSGSPLVVSTSNPSPSRSGRGQVGRTASYNHGLPLPPLDLNHVEGAGVDEVESSIQAQEEVIRRERQTKRLERAKEREREEETAGGAGSMSMLKRRSTRAGSTGEGGPGTGVLVGNLIGQDHANYVLMYNMLTGIRIAVSRCQAKPLRPLTDEDYSAKHKFSFDIVGNELTPSTKYDFKFKDYAPWVFRELREYFCLDPSDYLVSLTAKYILSELGSPGKSGSFFYFSRDYRFIIKTIRHSEHKFLRKILKEYHEYIKKNPHTLLSRFYGLHRVKLPRGRKIHFVIMNNLFPPHRDIHETYDLKGSAIGRVYPEEKARENPAAILKDLNWVERHRHLSLGPEKKALFEEQVRRDTELMQKLRIMDYSLLAGIHNIGRGNVDNLRDGMLTVFQPDTVKVRRKPTQLKRDADASAVRQAVQRSDPKALSDKNALPEQDTSERRMFIFYQDEGGFRGTGEENEDEGVIYYLGIIDILTPYTCVKALENFFKGFKHDRHMISAVPPVEYGDRFMAFIYSIIRGNDESKRPKMYETVKGELKINKDKSE